ncbi:bifunctional 2',3'-cyclic-nucleotide 2'-phosphodiesterase/3'-nucleotidase [Mesobacillus selenatarsenatis]|uniref:2',3'-cyclic-nucleotide 2'-phosphodiesterase n=1 Tax=Mesobacillus selenatarsenatis (strain DSM 18680 / JCM 14380 / FERM P-15431 / SF-1) TaxID=1321606 RepID=A0A0A8WYJ5_MESS1|nr:bifunctional 2',3'-cyclic-nucleotide 2'-phosphodiesterase/3'-nucleotidase [Mesobacillus selenatarsenatis]GAM12029.1 2',3'-cyclic-nucleotide 2'-phosphodiesterase [Mesobacillus selenatarsenatis SF-1]
MKKEFKKKLNGLAVSALTVGLLASPMYGSSVFAEGTPTKVMSSEALVKLKIMETTDVHGSIMNHDYFTDTEATKGLAKVSTLIKAERSENANNLLLDNGDMLQGNPFTDYVAKVNPLTFVDRLAGFGRYETAIDISKEGWDSAETVVLVRSDQFADALAAAPLAYKYNAPILLTQSDKLNADTKAEIKRLGAKRVVIVGGTGAVSADIQSTLSHKMKLWVKRLGGENRFDTAALVAEELGNSKKAILVNGHNYPDAISVAPYAAKNGLPILLTDAAALPVETKAALNGVTETILVGGTSVISDKVEESVKGASRFGGNSRFDTSYKVATELDSVKTRVFVATGRGFADALAGSVLAAKEDAPVVLVDKDSMLKKVAELVDGKSVTILGGDAVVSGSLIKNENHPIYEAMNELNYDAATLGNHEFNYGLDFLEGSMRTAEFPFVSANVYEDDHDNDPTNDKNFVKPYQIIDKEVVDEAGKKHIVKVGVIGFVAPQIMQWDKANLEGKVVTEDVVASAKKWVPQMKKDGAEIVVTLAHTGFDEDKSNKENTVFALSEVEGIDAILFGHTHKAFPSKDYDGIAGVDSVNGTINGVAAVQSVVDGSHLGVIDLTLEKVDGKWGVKGSKSEVLSAKTAEVDKKIVDVMQPSHEATVDYINQPIGQTTAPIYSYFARVQDDPSVQIVSNAQKEYIEDVMKGTEYEDLPVLSSAAPFKAGRNGADEYTYFPSGDISVKNVSDLYKYNNTVSALKLSGAQVKEYLEWTAVNFNQIDPNVTTEQSLINSEFPVYNFDTLDGVTYEIDVTQPAKYDKDGKVVNEGASRIKNLSYEGKPVADDQEFVIATNNYRAAFTKLANPDGQRVIYSSPDENRQVVMNYIIKNKTINPSADNNWTISPINGNVNVVFESSPAAKKFESESIKYAGEGKDGFAKYSIDLKGLEVQLLGINDFHGQLDTYNSKLNAGGVDYLAAYLKKHEAENPENTLMLHAGDAVGASSPVSALLQDEPTINIMNKLGFDVGTVGNHEFDEGVAEMLRLINGGSHPKTVDKYGVFGGADFSYVAANVVDEKTNEPILDPYVIKEVSGVPIGFIGIAYSDTPSIVTPSGVAGVKFTDEVEAINKYAAELKEQGVEAIVVITHNPAKSDSDGSNPTEELVEIAKNVDDEVDVMFGGHNHQYTNTIVDGKLLVQSYSYGTAFSDVDLLIDPVTKDIKKKTAAIVNVARDGITPDPEIKAILDNYIADVAPILNEKIGTTPGFISREANAHGESAMGNMVADAMRWKTGTDFAFMNSGGVRSDIDAGEITWKEAFTVQPFGNDLVKMEVTGAQIKTLLEQQWGSKVRIMPISGLKVTYDDTRAAGDRIVSIVKNDGTPVAPGETYSITVNNYMADGGDGYAILATIKDRTVDVVDLEAFVGYIKENGTVDPKIEGRVLNIKK